MPSFAVRTPISTTPPPGAGTPRRASWGEESGNAPQREPALPHTRMEGHRELRASTGRSSYVRRRRAPMPFPIAVRFRTAGGVVDQRVAPDGERFGSALAAAVVVDALDAVDGARPVACERRVERDQCPPHGLAVVRLTPREGSSCSAHLAAPAAGFRCPGRSRRAHRPTPVRPGACGGRSALPPRPAVLAAARMCGPAGHARPSMASHPGGMRSSVVARNVARSADAAVNAWKWSS
jgi:hypothetical protein